MWSALARVWKRPAKPRPEPCAEYDRLLEEYIRALEGSTAAHLKYVEALNTGRPEVISPAREFLDQADEVLDAAMARIKEHNAEHGCQGE